MFDVEQNGAWWAYSFLNMEFQGEKLVQLEDLDVPFGICNIQRGLLMIIFLPHKPRTETRNYHQSADFMMMRYRFFPQITFIQCTFICFIWILIFRAGIVFNFNEQM